MSAATAVDAFKLLIDGLFIGTCLAILGCLYKGRRDW